MACVASAGSRQAQAGPPVGREATAKPSKARSRRAQRLAAIKVPPVVTHRRTASNGETIVRTYEKQRELGKGGFARCFQFRCVEKSSDLAGKVVAKASLVKDRARLKLLTEIRVHRAISHPHVVNFHSFFEDDNNVYIFMELCPNGNLADMVRSRGALSEPEARGFMVQLVEACRYLHHHGIIHRDLKLGNVFLAGDMTLRVGDFGLATKLMSREERKRTVCGTPNYIAPEVLDSGDAGHSLEVDVWSLGVILYTMLVGRPPFETRDVKETYALIRRARFAFPAGCAAGPDAQSLVRAMLSVDPSRRPSLASVLTHPFFTGPAAFIPSDLPPSAAAVAPHLPASALVSGRSVIERLLAGSPAALRRHIRMTGPGTERPDEAPPPRAAAPTAAVVAAADVRRRFVAKAAGAPASSSAAAPEAPRRVALASVAANHRSSGRTAKAGASSRGALAAPPALPGRSAADARPPSSSTAAAGLSSGAPRGLAALSAGAGHTVRFQPRTAQPPAAPAVVAFEDDQFRSGAGAGQSGDAGRAGAGIGSHRAGDAEEEEDVDMGEEDVPAPHDAAGGRSGSQPDEEDVDMSSAGDAGRSSGLGQSAGAPVAAPPASSRTPAAPEARPGREPGTLARVVSALTRSLYPGEAAGTDESLAPPHAARVTASSSSSSEAAPSPRVWVVKWVDYTSKYGLGFLLSDGSVGVHFMDLSKIVAASDGHVFEYCPALPHEDRPRDPATGRRHSPVERHSASSYPPRLKKKVTLLLHFRKYLLDHWQRAVDDGSALPEDVASIAAGGPPSGLVFLRKWLRTEHAAVFRLSDRTVQACFFDGSTVTLSPDAAAAIFTDKLGNRSRHELSTVAERGGASLVKRLRYVKDLLASLITEA